MKNTLEIITDFISDMVEHGFSEDSVREIKLGTHAYNKLILENGHYPKEGNVITLFTQIGSIVVKRDVRDEIDGKLSIIKDLESAIEALKKDL